MGNFPTQKGQRDRTNGRHQGALGALLKEAAAPPITGVHAPQPQIVPQPIITEPALMPEAKTPPTVPPVAQPTKRMPDQPGYKALLGMALVRPEHRVRLNSQQRRHFNRLMEETILSPEIQAAYTHADDTFPRLLFQQFRRIADEHRTRSDARYNELQFLFQKNDAGEFLAPSIQAHINNAARKYVRQPIYSVSGDTFDKNPLHVGFANGVLGLAAEWDLPFENAGLNEKRHFRAFLHKVLSSPEMREALKNDDTLPDRFADILVRNLAQLAQKDLISASTLTPGYAFMLSKDSADNPILTPQVEANTRNFAKACVEYMWPTLSKDNPPSSEILATRSFIDALADKVGHLSQKGPQR